MFDYLEDVIVECTEDLRNNRSYYPRKDYFFKVAKDLPRLLPEDTDIFR